MNEPLFYGPSRIIPIRLLNVIKFDSSTLPVSYAIETDANVQHVNGTICCKSENNPTSKAQIDRT